MPLQPNRNSHSARDPQAEEAAARALLDAASKGDLARVTMLVARGALIDGTSDGDWTALHSAAYEGHTDVIRYLLDHGAAIDRAGDNWTALHLACSTGKTEAVRLLLEAGADPDAPSRGGSTALMAAAEKGHVTAMQLLLDAGAKIDTQQGRNWTALAIAAEYDRLGAVKFLLDNGANRSLSTCDGRTALSCAVFKDTENPDPYFANCHPTPDRNEIVNLLKNHPGGTRKPSSGVKPAPKQNPPQRLTVPKPLKPLKLLPSKKGPFR